MTAHDAERETLETSFIRFKNRMLTKALEKADQGRPLCPWDHYDVFFFIYRLKQELNDELAPLFDGLLPKGDFNEAAAFLNVDVKRIEEMKKECLDIGNFAAFLFLRLEKIKGGLMFPETERAGR